MEETMLRLGLSVAALAMLGMGAASADMIAGTFFCSQNPARHELVWQGASPADIFEQGSRCGSETRSCNANQSQAFLNEAEDRKCEATTSGTDVSFVCTGKVNQLKKHVDALCEQTIP